MKRFFHFFAACALLLTIGVSSISAQAQAEIVVNHVKIGDLYYNLYDDGTAGVTYDDLRVYSLSSIKNYVGLTEANIPSSVTTANDGKTYIVTSIGAAFLCPGARVSPLATNTAKNEGLPQVRTTGSASTLTRD